MNTSFVESQLLKNIKTAVNTLLSSQNCRSNEAHLTDAVRRDILNILVTFSDQIPHPGSLSRLSNQSDNSVTPTLSRWQILAYISGVDLTIAKWFESHLDALSILNELKHDRADYDKTCQGLWAVWAAEGHPDPITYDNGLINGSKAWCSGANLVSYGLMTYRDDHGRSQLLVVDMTQQGIGVDNQSWQAVGMQATDTATLTFTNVKAHLIGAPNAYLDRVGFWHGAAGVASCWYGAASALASYLNASQRHKANDFKAMYLGQVSSALVVNRQCLIHLAGLIDSQPQRSHELYIRQLRLSVETLAREVLDSVGQALGAAPFCVNSHFAQLSADLTVFIRQSHGAFDARAIGQLTTELTEHLAEDEDNKGKMNINLWQL